MSVTRVPAALRERVARQARYRCGYCLTMSSMDRRRKHRIAPLRICVAARSEWFYQVAWDIGLIALLPDRESLAVLAATDID